MGGCLRTQAYSTNNFLGRGETLQVQISLGNLARSVLFGYTQPYMFDRPLQFGFTVGYRWGRQAIGGGECLSRLGASLPMTAPGAYGEFPPVATA